MTHSKFLRHCLTCGLLFLTLWAQAQTGGVRGTILDKQTGLPIPYTTIFLEGTNFGAVSADDGFYTITNVPVGEYLLRVDNILYDSFGVSVKIVKGSITTQNVQLSERAEEINAVEVSAEREAERNDVRISVVRVTPKDINRIPAAGGEADFAQYLQVVPGVVFTGDQGGQLYIRGGAPIQNKIIMDGMPIYSPFHSLGFFSVFETETIRSADIYTGGFNAMYGGRSSAVIDIKTREGNRRRFSGMVNVNPFVGKVLLEGPIIPLNEDGSGSSLSYLITAKHSYLNQTSKWFYPYANDNKNLPYTFTDIFGKISLNTPSGSRLNAFAFNFRDDVRFTGIAEYAWRAGGGGLDFRIVPGASQMIMEGAFSFSTYSSNFVEGNSSKERSSGINSFNGQFNFYYNLGYARDLNYGVDITSFRNDFAFTNNNGIPFDQQQSNTEMAGFVRYKGKHGRWVLEPSIRAQFYASLGEFRAEPRLGIKYNITSFLRIKAAGGLYSQNLISSVDERDVVNLFIGFLGGPDDGVYRIENGQYIKTKSRLQTSYHAVGGVEVNVTKNLTLNLEPYWKRFPQIINLNRNPNDATRYKFVAEEGSAYGVDLTATYEQKQLYLYLAYSLSYTDRNDGIQQYYAHFDRRHNLNFVASYEFNLGKAPEGKKGRSKYPFEASIRWNLGSGFPFTLTQGFYPWQTFADGLSTNYLTNNTNPGTQLGIVYEEQLNRGRLPYYHRLDLSLRYTVDFTKFTKLQLGISLTNAYNRENIFYFDRIEYKRINQLPIMPSLNVNFKF
jgi:opacity protein-like surface antigen